MQVTPLISELGRTRMEVNAKVKAGFGAKDFALNVVITIPVPDTTAKADIHTSIGGHLQASSSSASCDASLFSCVAQCFSFACCRPQSWLGVISSVSQ